MKRKKSIKALKNECLKIWGKIVLKRDQKCVTCGAPAKHPHHLFPRSRYRHLWFSLQNGVGLCVSCHYRMHYDPVVPVLYLQAKYPDRMNSLMDDALNGRRRNPYKRSELENINVALRASE